MESKDTHYYFNLYQEFFGSSNISLCYNYDEVEELKKDVLKAIKGGKRIEGIDDLKDEKGNYLII